MRLQFSQWFLSQLKHSCSYPEYSLCLWFLPQDLNVFIPFVLFGPIFRFTFTGWIVATWLFCFGAVTNFFLIIFTSFLNLFPSSRSLVHHQYSIYWLLLSMTSLLLSKVVHLVVSLILYHSSFYTSANCHESVQILMLIRNYSALLCIHQMFQYLVDSFEIIFSPKTKLKSFERVS